MQAARIVRRLSSAAMGALVAGTLAVAPGTAVLASGQDITVAGSAGSTNFAALAGPLQTAGYDPKTEISPRKFAETAPPIGKASTGTPTVAPNPAGGPVTTSTSASGFDGLNHADQRNAGTGPYVNTQFSLEPPDQGLCVGNGFVVEAVNTAMQVYNTAGHALAPGPVALNQFFKLTPEINRNTGVRGEFTSDPKCLFDPATNRFFLTVLEIDIDGIHSHVLIAVTKSGDPTDDWNLFKIDTTDISPSHPTCAVVGCFGDQPLIGLDKSGFFVSTNEFANDGSAFNGAQLYAMSKSKLAHGISPSVVHIDAGAISTPDTGGIWYSLQPAVPSMSGRGDSRSSDRENGGGGTEYFVGALQFFASPTLDNRLVVFNMTNTQSLNRATPSLGLTHRVIQSETYGQPPVATQKAGLPRPLGIAHGEPLTFLNSNDDRMNQVVLADGRLWSGLNTVIGSGASARVGIAWFAIDPNGEDAGAKVENQGYVVGPGAENVMFPSIAVGDAGPVMVFTLTGPNHFPSAAIKRLLDDSSIEIVGAGTGPADGFTGYKAFKGDGVERWGDYSAATTAPDGSIWLATEYIGPRPRTPFANWGTFITHVTGDHEGHQGN